jgi:hypothetical protein
MIFRASRDNVLKWNGVQVIVGGGPESLRAVLQARTRTGGDARAAPEVCDDERRPREALGGALELQHLDDVSDPARF